MYYDTSMQHKKELKELEFSILDKMRSYEQDIIILTFSLVLTSHMVYPSFQLSTDEKLQILAKSLNRDHTE